MSDPHGQDLQPDFLCGALTAPPDPSAPSRRAARRPAAPATPGPALPAEPDHGPVTVRAIAGRAPTLDEAREVLRTYWKYPDFRPGQREAVAAALAGGDVLAIMPTGGGKSIVYQVAAALRPGVSIVVCPLISLMQDQIGQLAERRYPATFLNSTLRAKELRARKRDVEAGCVKLLYVSPERFDSEEFRAWVSGLDVPLLAVDEAHCVSEWGHDFRPAYMRLGEQRALLRYPQVLALTATATAAVRGDIIKQLALRDPRIQVSSFDRPNLRYRVVDAARDDSKVRALLHFLGSNPGPAIVYTNTRDEVDALVALLGDNGIATVGYHGGMEGDPRREIQERFMGGDARVVVATNAFGMGVDKADVRMVVHYRLPPTLEAYYQEAGRAGRDGHVSQCVMLYGPEDRRTPEFQIRLKNPDRAVVEAVYLAADELADRDGWMLDAEGKGIPQRLVAERANRHAARGAFVRDEHVSAAYGILDAAGVIRHVGRGQEGVHVRLRTPVEVLAFALDGPRREAHLAVLRALYKQIGPARLTSDEGIGLSRRVLASVPGGERALRAVLDQGASDQLLEWRPEERGTRILLRGRTPAQLRDRIDWRAVGDRLDRALAKLARMEEYATTAGCRRADLLRYFGDPGSTRSCGNCDRCLAAAVGP